MTKTSIALTGVPETMLWTLHNRATEAARADAKLHDPEAVRIYRSIDYDYERNFGTPDSSHPMRSKMFDDAIRPWMAARPGGTVVELACGLETEVTRVDDGKIRWVCVDVPEAIEVRERFLKPNERCRHVAKSALDLGWMDEVDASRPVFVTAQGLLMYFEEKDVARLVGAIFERFADVELMFDSIPRWFSQKTLRGFGKTRHYRAPPMPWGVDRNEIDGALRKMSPSIGAIEVEPYGAFRGVLGALLPILSEVPGLRNFPPCVVRARSRAS